MADWAEDLRLSDSEDEAEFEGELETSVSSTIFLIDASHGMLAGKDRMLETILRGSKELMKRRIVAGTGRDKVGVVFYNVDVTSNSPMKQSQATQRLRKKHVYDLQPLAAPSVDSIKGMSDAILDISQIPDALVKSLGVNSSGEDSLVDALKHCSGAFKAFAPKLSNRRLYFFTASDDPFPTSAHPSGTKKSKKQLKEELDFEMSAINAAYTQAKNLNEMGIELVPFFIGTEDKPFVVEKFYSKFLIENESNLQGLEHEVDEDNNVTRILPISVDAKEKLDLLMQQLKVKQPVKRALFNVPLTLGDGLTISITGYSYIQEQLKPSYTKVDLDSRTGAEVVSKTEWIDTDTAEVLNPKTDIKSCLFLGGKSERSEPKRVIFSPEEMRKLKSLGMEPGIKLLGFKDPDELKWEHNITTAKFIYPSEKVYTGSTRVFSALLQSMLKLDKIGLAFCYERRASAPRFVYLVPKKEEVDEDGIQIEPPGIVVIPLPYSDDIRENKIEKTVTCMTRGEGDEKDLEEEAGNHPEIEKAKEAIAKMRIKFEPENFPNPGLNHHYECLSAIALNEDIPTIDDKTKPDFDRIQQRVGEIIKDFKDLINVHPNAENFIKVETKSRATKRKVVDDDDAAEATEKVIKLFSEGKENKLTIQDLKTFLISKQANINSKMKKADLIEAAKEYVTPAKGMKEEPMSQPPKKKKRS
ncbi:SPOC domain-like protein [Atractiella rhizophila]|nr:SPOC domain-like protein [Atractiella rhizophila]